MKKFFTIFILFFISLLVGCSEEKDVYKVLLPSGTPLMAVGDLLDDKDFQFEVVNGQDVLNAGFVNNEYDMIIAPLNLGAKLYLAETSKYQLEAIITTNNTYLISNEELKISDLNEKKILAYGAGSSPYIALNAGLKINNVNATIETLTSASDVTNMFIADNSEYDAYLSAEPNITILKEKKKLSVYSLDVSALIKSEASVLIQACLFCNPDSNVSDQILNKIKENITTMNSNADNYAKAVIEKNSYFQTLGEEVIKKSIPNSNITYLKANENLEIINEYYQLLNKYNPKILSGVIPNEGFYKK